MLRLHMPVDQRSPGPQTSTQASHLATDTEPSSSRGLPSAHDRAPLAPRPPLERPSDTVPDWSREACGPWDYWPGAQLLGALREYQAPHNQGSSPAAVLRRKLAVLRYRFWSIAGSIDIPLNCKGLAGGLLLPHPQGIVVHPEVQIGPNCTLFQQVTLGGGPRPGFPVLGGAVDVGPGAKILGGVTIGNGARIGANAVVIDDVPAGAIAVGIPAVVKLPR